jgi:hypothetical protein
MSRTASVTTAQKNNDNSLFPVNSLYFNSLDQ